jgi:hypothetical protein
MRAAKDSIVKETYEKRKAWNLAQELIRAEDDQAASGAFDDQYLRRDQLDNLPHPEPIIDGILNRHAYALISGRDGTFKSFIALDWSLCIATGKPWQGREVQQGRVLYIAGEGAYGIADRVKAWEEAWRTKVDPEMFTLRQSAVNLFRGGPALADLLARLEDGEYVLSVHDTLRRSSGGAEGNGSDMGVVVDNIERVKRATADGSVLVPAHTDKGDNDTRGFSGIEDDADIVWQAKRDRDRDPLAVNLECVKMKDGPDGLVLPLQMVPASRSLVVSAGTTTGQALAEDIQVTDRTILDAMRETFAETGATSTELVAVTGMPSSTFYKARGRLLKTSWLKLQKRGSTERLVLAVDLAPDDISPWHQGAGDE